MALAVMLLLLFDYTWNDIRIHTQKNGRGKVAKNGIGAIVSREIKSHKSNAAGIRQGHANFQPTSIDSLCSIHGCFDMQDLFEMRRKLNFNIMKSMDVKVLSSIIQ